MALPEKSILKWYLLYVMGILLVILAILFFLTQFESSIFPNKLKDFSFLEIFRRKEFFIYLLVGFVAQLIDGALGMAYGVSSTSFLMNLGVTPVVASASVHVAEVFTTGMSGLSHWKFENLNKELFKKLAIPGAVGAALGAYVLSSFDGAVMKPYISAYLLMMGCIIVTKAFRKRIRFSSAKNIRKLALFGGFVDACGGGGWGPVVTATLIGSGNHPRWTIGTVIAVEFFVALAASGVFTLFVTLNSWPVILGLIGGGLLAAPLGAYFCKRVNVRLCMIVVGLLVILLSVRTLFKFFF